MVTFGGLLGAASQADSRITEAYNKIIIHFEDVTIKVRQFY